MSSRFVSQPNSEWESPGRFLELIENDWYQLLVALQDRVSVATYAFWSEKGLKTMSLPVTTNAVSSPMGLGSDSLPVAVELNGTKTHLADSMQFGLEYGCRFSEQGAYYIMPSFRGEDADSSHLSQFFHSEVEIVGDLDRLISIAEEYVRTLSRSIVDAFSDRLVEAVGTVQHLEAAVAADSFPRLALRDACDLLDNQPGLVSQHELGFVALTRRGEQELIGRFAGPVWVTNFEHSSVPFYQAYDVANPDLAMNADLLMGIGEVIGGGQRHSTGSEVRQALRDHHVGEEVYQWYIDLKDRYPLQTSGFGMGIERFLAWVLRHNDVRDMQLFVRSNGVSTTP